MSVPKVSREGIGSSRVFASTVVAVLLLGHTGSSAGGPLVKRVSILERGIYAATSTGLTAAIGTLGAVQHVRNVKLIESTTRIPARKLVRFGVRYVVHGVPRGAEVEIRMITRFPDSGASSDADNRLQHSQSEYKVRSLLGSVGYREFFFDDTREIMPGEWSFEFWVGTTKLGEQKFCVYEVDAANPTSRDGCPALVASVR